MSSARSADPVAIAESPSVDPAVKGQVGGVPSSLGIKMSHVLRMMLTFCDDSVARRERQVLLVSLCEQMASWAPASYFEQQNLSETAYEIYFVGYFGRAAINQKLTRPGGLHRKRFISTMSDSFITTTMKNPVFTRWSSIKWMSDKSSSNPVQAAARKFLVGTLNIWLHKTSSELNLEFNNELENIQRYLYTIDRVNWSTYLVVPQLSSSMTEPQLASNFLDLQQQVRKLEEALANQSGGAGRQSYGHEPYPYHPDWHGYRSREGYYQTIGNRNRGGEFSRDAPGFYGSSSERTDYPLGPKREIIEDQSPYYQMRKPGQTNFAESSELADYGPAQRSPNRISPSRRTTAHSDDQHERRHRG